MKPSSPSVVTVSSKSAESVTAASPSPMKDSQSQSKEVRTSNTKDKKKPNFKRAPGIFERKAILSLSDDPDINALFEVIINESDGQRLFLCRECKHSFDRPYSARRHSNIHLKHRHVNCGICSHRATGPLSLELHHKQEHKGQKIVVVTNNNTKTTVTNNNTKKTVNNNNTKKTVTNDNTKKTKHKSTTKTAGTSKEKSKAETLPLQDINLECAIKLDLETKVDDAVVTTGESDGSSKKKKMMMKSPKNEKLKSPEKDEKSKEDAPQAVKMDEVIVETPQVIVETPDEADEGEKAEASESSTTQERRSTRIRMRKEIEDSAIEEESKRPRKDTPPPMYPSNIDKLKESKAMSASKQKKKHRGHNEGAMKSRSYEKSGLTPTRASSIDLIYNVVESLERTPPSNEPPSSDSTEEPFAVLRALPPSLLTTRIREDLLIPLFPSTGLQIPSYSSSVLGISLTTTNDQTGVGLVEVTSGPVYIHGSTNNYYPRLSGLYGDRVHLHQPKVMVARSNLYPAPLSHELIKTIYHPSWFNQRETGLDDDLARAVHGNSYQLMLSAKMHGTETMVAKSLKALEETSIPVPPLEPLLPSPCRVLFNVPCDPLSTVLGSLPKLSSNPSSFSLLAMQSEVEARYTIASQSSRYHMWTRNGDRRWWEVREFPSLKGLSTRPNPRISAARPTDLLYSTANNNWKGPAFTCKLSVSSSGPISSVLKWPSPAVRQHPIVSTPVCRSSSPSNSGFPTPSSTPPGSYAAQQPLRSRPAASRRIPSEGGRQPSTSTRTRTVSKRKREVDETGSEVGAHVNRMDSPLHEFFPGVSMQSPSQALHGLQQADVYCTQVMQSEEDYYLQMVPLAQPYCAQGEQTRSYYSEQSPSSVAIDQDGTTFTVL